MTLMEMVIRISFLVAIGKVIKSGGGKIRILFMILIHPGKGM